MERVVTRVDTRPWTTQQLSETLAIFLVKCVYVVHYGINHRVHEKQPIGKPVEKVQQLDMSFEKTVKSQDMKRNPLYVFKMIDCFFLI